MIVHSVVFYNLPPARVKSECRATSTRLDRYGGGLLHTPNHAKIGLLVRALAAAGRPRAGAERRSVGADRGRQGLVHEADREVSVGVRQGAVARAVAQERS